jgi:hypothetical protein
MRLQALSLHFVLPDGHDVEHCPSLQTPPAGQAVQLVPQWSVLDATHAPLHETNPGEQAQAPAWQVVLAAQTSPHVPQFWLSFCTSMQVPLHSICPDAQLLLPPPDAFVQLATSSAKPRAITDTRAVFMTMRNSGGGERGAGVIQTS